MAEFAGLALAVPPLIVSVFEQYSKTTKCIRAFRTHAKIVKSNLTILRVQEAIFHRANLILLQRCTSEDQARQMLGNPDHIRWYDDEFIAAYHNLVKDSEEALRGGIELICEELKGVKKALYKVEDPRDCRSHELKRRIKIVMKDSSFEERLKKLGDHTQYFLSLVKLCIPFESRHQSAPAALTTERQLKAYRAVQERASDLYQALQSACTKHSNHQAHLNLEPSLLQSAQSQVKFSVAFSRLSLESNGAGCCTVESTWLTVESIESGRTQPPDGKQDYTVAQASLKRVHACLKPDREEPTEKPRAKLIKKRVAFQEQEPASSRLEPPRRHIPQPQLINFCSHSNFCNDLQRFLRTSHTRNAAVGYLESTQGSKHLIYLDTSSTLASSKGKTPSLSSLQNVLIDMNKGSGQVTLSMPEQVRLAMQLAKAVLRFHSTRWLQDSWTSREVQLAQVDAKEKDGPRTFLAARISPRSTAAESQPLVLPGPVLIRNRLLFSLGVMLIELAYRQPFNTLILPEDRRRFKPGEVEFCTAERLSSGVSGKLGPEYGEATRRLIHTDFGEDFSLEKSRLQRSFYQSIICELEALEKRWRDAVC